MGCINENGVLKRSTPGSQILKVKLGNNGTVGQLAGQTRDENEMIFRRGDAYPLATRTNRSTRDTSSECLNGSQTMASSPNPRRRRWMLK